MFQMFIFIYGTNIIFPDLELAPHYPKKPLMEVGTVQS